MMYLVAIVSAEFITNLFQSIAMQTTIYTVTGQSRWCWPPKVVFVRELHRQNGARCELGNAPSMTINVVFQILPLCFFKVPSPFSTTKLFQECGKLRLRAKGVCVAVGGPKRRPVPPEPLKQEDGESSWDWERVGRVGTYIEICSIMCHESCLLFFLCIFAGGLDCRANCLI